MERVAKVLALMEFLNKQSAFSPRIPEFPEETEARLLRYKLRNFLTQEVLRIIIRK